MIRIGFIGVPGAGKTTTSRAVAGYIRTHTRYKTIELVDEYARRFIIKYGIDHLQDQVRIMNKQAGEEDKFPLTTDVLITDSPVFLGFGYAIQMREEGNPKHTMILNDIYKEMNKMNEVPRYDIIFHLPPTHTPVKDGVRGEEQFNPEWRTKMDTKLLSIFHIFPPRKLITIQSDSLDDRVKECMRHINEYDPDKRRQSLPTSGNTV